MCIVDYTKNMVYPRREEFNPFQHTKQDKIIDNNLKVPRSTTTRFSLELDGKIVLQQVRPHPRSSSGTMNGSRIKVGIIGDLQSGMSKFSKVEIISTRRRVAQVKHTTRSDSESLFSYYGNCFSLACKFQFPGNRRGVNRTPCHIACTDAHLE